MPLAAEDAAEDVFEASPRTGVCLRGAACSTLNAGEVKSAKVHRPPPTLLLARIGFGLRGVNLVGVEPDLVVDLALLLVAENVVGLGDFLERLLGLLVVRVHIRVIFSRGLAKRLADIILRCILLDAEDCVVVLVLGRWHVLASGC